MNIKARNPITSILLSLVTCGLYGMYWAFCMAKEAISVKEDDDNGMLEAILMIFLPFIYMIIFHYVPMTGIQIAFKDFMLNLGTWGSEWIGFEHFERFFNAYNFWTILSNTLILSVVSLAFSFPLSVGLALLLNEIRHKRLNSALQTIFIAPHFVSTVVVVGMMQAFLSPETGVINIILEKLGFIEEGIYFTRLEQWFRPMYIISGIWQNLGWNAIIYLSALSAIDTSLY